MKMPRATHSRLPAVQAPGVIDPPPFPIVSFCQHIRQDRLVERDRRSWQMSGCRDRCEIHQRRIWVLLLSVPRRECDSGRRIPPRWRGRLQRTGMCRRKEWQSQWQRRTSVVCRVAPFSPFRSGRPRWTGLRIDGPEIGHVAIGMRRRRLRSACGAGHEASVGVGLDRGRMMRCDGDGNGDGRRRQGQRRGSWPANGG